MANHFPSKKEFNDQFYNILRPEAGFYRAVLVYSIAISLLTLAVPISLQLLVDTIANIALTRAVILISSMLFFLLFLSSIMYALRAYVMELFTRKVYSRISSEIAMTAMLAEPDYFEENQKTDLFNRYFDILTIKKSVPNILTNGFTLVLQSIIGFTVVSFYHFYFFIFCLVLVLLIFLVWKIWGWAAITTSFSVSESKYQTAAWLQSLSVNVDSFRNSLQPSFVMEETDRFVETHIECQKNHFKNTYSVLLSFLLLYSLASAVLLGMGGWLVILGELTLGQLVAAELIMSAIFAGLPQMAGYLDYFFDVCAAIEELSRFKEVKTDKASKNRDQKIPSDNSIEFANVLLERNDQEMRFNFKVPQSGVYRVSGDAFCMRWMAELLRANYLPTSGLITIGGIDNADIELRSLRQSVRVIDRVALLPMTVKEYLDLFMPENSALTRQEALACLHLDKEISNLKRGHDTMLSRSAYPLTQPQSVRLKLASALLSQPSVLVLGDIVDVVDAEIVDGYIKKLRENNTTVLYFTRRKDMNCFDYKLEINAQLQNLSDASGETI